MTDRRPSVLMALSSTHHGFFRGLARCARERSWCLDTHMAYTNQIPHGWRGDGILSFCGHWAELADFVRGAGVPTVELCGVCPDLAVPRVRVDNLAVGRTAATYLLERRFRHFAWAPLADDTPNDERCFAFRATLAEAGLSARVLPTASPHDALDWVGARQHIADTLLAMPKPLAVFAYNDGVGVMVVEICQEAGLLVPEQVAVLGVDDDATACECVSVPLSSIRLDLEELAYRGGCLLDRLMQGQAPPAVPRLAPGPVVTRHSTDILAMGNLRVARALRTIWTEHADPRLTVGHVAERVGLTPCGLLKAFRAELGRTVHEEIMRRRLTHVEELLLETPLSVAAIAERSGFASANHLSRAFRRHRNTSPGAFRRARRTRG